MSGFIQLLIAVLLAYVAWQTYKINDAALRIQRDKLRLDLLDKRILVFEACQKLVLSVVRDGATTREALFEFSAGSSNVEFFYGNEIKKYVEEIRSKGLRLIHLHEKLANPRFKEELSELAKETEEIESWFDNQLDNSKVLFRKYLHFSIDKAP